MIINYLIKIKSLFLIYFLCLFVFISLTVQSCDINPSSGGINHLILHNFNIQNKKYVKCEYTNIPNILLLKNLFNKLSMIILMSYIR